MQQSRREGKLSDLLSLPGEGPKPYIAPGGGECRAILAEDQIAMITGQPGAGKSYLMALLSTMLAAGENWGGKWKAVRPVPVLYVLTEGSVWDLQERVVGPAKALGWWNDEVDERWQFWMPMGLDLTGGADKRAALPLEELNARIQVLGAKVVFIDSFYAAISGDPSKAETASLVARNLNALKARNPGLTVVLVHHDHRQRLDEDGEPVNEDKPYLGSIILEAMLDQMWHYDKSNKRSSSARIRQVKGRSRFQKFDSFWIDLDDSLGVLRPQESSSTTQSLAVRQFFRATKGEEVSNALLEAWAAEHGYSRSQVMEHRKALVNEGVVEQVRPGIYRLAEFQPLPTTPTP